MDPATAAMNLATAAIAGLTASLSLVAKVWDAMPKEQQTAVAADIGKSAHNCMDRILAIEARIDAAVATVK